MVVIQISVWIQDMIIGFFLLLQDTAKFLIAGLHEK